MAGLLERARRALEGRYEVEGVVGSGGMGVVFLARDPRLERRVAIKSLQDRDQGSAERLERLRREAKLLAALNHPSIATIHGLEETADGGLYIVLEFVEGDTLAERLQSGPLTLRSALTLSRQMAEALEAAHRIGIVHRDLKPSNVMLLPDGRLKVLDFGLAQQLRLRVPSDSLTTISTTYPAIDPSRAMGTPGYASPEQLRGDPLDAGTDLFSLGCVLYECLAGERVFPGSTPLDAVIACLGTEPDWTRLPADTPGTIRSLLQRCLVKSRQERCRSATEALEILDTAFASLGDKAENLPAEDHHVTAGRLPRPLTSFIGRVKELEECKRLLSRARLLTLTGAGGCGKTRLAIRLAETLRPYHPGGIWFVDLGAIAEPSRVAQAVASAVSLREVPGRRLTDSLVDLLRNKKGLLILDNCEHVLSHTASLAARLLRETPELTLLATSREALALAGEQVFRVPSLELPPATDVRLEAARQSEAVRLFEARATLVRPDFSLSDSSFQTVVEICRHLDGIPLALELAAARVSSLTLEELCDRLDDRFRLLTSRARDTTPRHQALRTALQWSYDHLPEVEQVLFRRLGVFSPSWTLTAATSICSEDRDEIETLDGLTRLIDKSLVMMERGRSGATRYRMLESSRHFALELLQTSGEEDAVRARHFDYFSQYGRDAEAKLMGAEQGTTLIAIDADHENLLAALRWCERPGGRVEDAVQVTSWLWRYWFARGYFSVARDHLDRVLAHEIGSPPSVELAKTLNGAGLITMLLADYPAATAHYERCLQVAQTIGDGTRIAGAYNGLGAVAGYGRGDYEAAREYFALCLAEYRQQGDERGVAIALLNLGDAATRQGHPTDAIPLFEESLKIRRRVEDAQGVAVTLGNLAVALLRTGGAGMARQALSESLAIIEQHELRYRGVDMLEVVAELQATVGEWERAAVLMSAAGAARETLGTPLPQNEIDEKSLLRQRIVEHLGAESFRKASECGAIQPYDSALRSTLEWLRTSGRGQ